jgi:hypothetical protein
MACSCKHLEQEIQDYTKQIESLKVLFWNRLTTDSSHQDRRKKDYNQALFHHWSDEDPNDERNWFQCWSDMTPHMVMRAFDAAMQDWRKTFCDVDGCKRK